MILQGTCVHILREMYVNCLFMCICSLKGMIVFVLVVLLALELVLIVSQMNFASGLQPALESDSELELHVVELVLELEPALEPALEIVLEIVLELGLVL